MLSSSGKEPLGHVQQSCEKIHTVYWKALRMRSGYPLLLVNDRSRKCSAPKPLSGAATTYSIMHCNSDKHAHRTIVVEDSCTHCTLYLFFPVLTPFLSTNCLLLQFHQLDMPLQNTSTTPGLRSCIGCSMATSNTRQKQHLFMFISTNIHLQSDVRVTLEHNHSWGPIVGTPISLVKGLI